MRWYEAKSVEELKEIGKLNTVKREINKDIRRVTGRKDLSSFIKMGSNSWKGQYEKILSIKKIGLEFGESETKCNNDGQAFSNERYFKSKADKYIFCLLELNGEERMKQLKIYKSLYINQDAAKQWYSNITKVIHPDICKDKRAGEAMSELRSIYDKMINHE